MYCEVCGALLLYELSLVPANFVHVIFHSSCLDLIIIKPIIIIIIINWLFIFSVYSDFYLQG
jgi:hypothetical protein